MIQKLKNNYKKKKWSYLIVDMYSIKNVYNKVMMKKHIVQYVLE